MKLDKPTIQRALGLELGEWRPPFDVPHLTRPRRRPDDLPGDGRVAAVLLLVFEVQNDPWFALTRRNENLSKHAGQISFPGGRQDPGETLLETALRETQEELGIPRQQVEVLGQLNTVYIPPSDFTVHPFVGWHSKRPDWAPEPEEVAEVIESPIERLFQPDTRQTGEVRNQDHPIIAPFYAIEGHRVWGATALILCEFIERCKMLEV